MSSADQDNAGAGELIERLLVDPDFRAEFRRDPAAACAAAGLPELAAELTAAGPAMDTLAVRESRSSLAGVVMAVAVEGMSVGEAQSLIRHGLAGAPRGALPHGGALRGPFGHVHGAASPAALERRLGGPRGGPLAHQLNGGGHAAASAAPATAGSSPGAAGARVDAVGLGGSGASTALLDSPRLTAPAGVRAFLTGGAADPRLVSVLNTALANHSIGLGQVEAVSDPVHVQVLDIVSVDGQRVGPNNLAARDLVTEIAALDPSVRPSEIGTPWPIRSQGFFSGGPADRLHLAFEMPGADSPAGAGEPLGGGRAAAGNLAPAASSSDLAPAPSADVALASVAPAPLAASTPGSGVEAALAYARAMIGKLPESAGSNLGPQLDRFEADFGFHGAPWCGIFVGHVLEAAGLKPPHTVAAVASILDLARRGDPPFLRGVLPVSEARPGDLVTFGGTEHVALVTKVDAAGVHTIAGNTSQSNVSETTYPPSSVTGVVRPDYGAGKPGSMPGVWSYAGVQPPADGVAAEVPAAAPVDPAVPTAQPPTAPEPGTAGFNHFSHHGRVRATVQFLPAVQPRETPEAAAPQAAAVASAPQPGAGGLLDQAAAVAPASPGGSISVSSSLLTPGQAKFAGRLAELTGLDPRVVAAWELAEESGSAAQGREAASNFNWLNIGYFDSGAGRIAFDKTFSDPISAAEQSAKFLKGEWGGASPSIRAILNTAGRAPDEQMAAIASSDWASSHYGGGANLHGTYDELSEIQVEKNAVA